MTVTVTVTVTMTMTTTLTLPRPMASRVQCSHAIPTRRVDEPCVVLPFLDLSSPRLEARSSEAARG